MDGVNEAELRRKLLGDIQTLSKSLDDLSLDVASFKWIQGRIEGNVKIIEWLVNRRAEPKGKQVQLDSIVNDEKMKNLGELAKEMMGIIANPALGAVEDVCALLDHPQEISFGNDGVKIESNKCYCCQKSYKNKVSK